MGNKPYLAFYQLKTKNLVISLIYFLLLLLIYRTESILKINTHYLGTDQADGGLYVWLFKSNLKDLWELPWFNTRAFYPYTLSLAWSDNFILPAIVAKPFVLLGLPVIIVYNLCLLGATFLNGFCTFKIAYQLSHHFLGSLIAGTIFLGFPFFVLHLGHPQLQFAFWIPLVFGLYCKFLHQPKFTTAILLGFTLFLSFLTTVYYTIFIVVALLLITLALIAYQTSFFSKKNIYPAILGLIIGLAPIIPFALPYLEVKDTYGTRDLISVSTFGASLIAYFSAPSSHLLIDFTAIWSKAEAQLFPGIVCLLSLLVVVMKLGRQNPMPIIRELAMIFLMATCIQIMGFAIAVWFYWLVFFGFL
ncbi:MAG: hypothetical protein WD512_08650, partial [Candidatus Paceibacterota bacterium]